MLKVLKGIAIFIIVVVMIVSVMTTLFATGVVKICDTHETTVFTGANEKQVHKVVTDEYTGEVIYEEVSNISIIVG